MPKHSRQPEGSSSKFFSLNFFVVAAVVIGVVLVVAVLFRPGSFRVVAQGQGTSVEFKFDDSRIDLNEILEQLLKRADSGTDAASKRRVIESILQAHGFYPLPSVEAATVLRGMQETEATREFVRAVRAMLYDLAGPFSRPATFLDAPDDRVLLAIDDLFQHKPASPVLAKLWEMSLDMKGIFAPRDIKVSIREDRNLKTRVAATCHGSILLGRVSLLRIDEAGRMVEVRVTEAKPCGPTSPEGLLADQRTTVWISPADMHDLTGNGLARSEQDLHAILTPLPKDLSPETPAPSG
jgi:hypothetical protein